MTKRFLSKMTEAKKQDAVYSNLRNNMLWNASGNLVYLGLQWLITVLVVRINGYTDAGILSLAMSISAIFQNVASFGVRNYQVSDLQSKYTDSQYVSLRWITCILSFVLCSGFVQLNSYSLKQEGSILLFMLFRIAENYVDVLHGIAQKRSRLDLAGKSFLLRGLFTFIVFLLSYFITKNLNFSIACMAIISFIFICLYDARKIRRLSEYHLCFKDKKMKEIVLECLPLCIYMILFAALTMIPRYCLERIMGSETLGGYASIFAPALLIQAAATYLYVPLISVFAGYRKTENVLGYYGLFWKITAAILGGTVILVVGVYLIGDVFLAILFGESILEFSYLFPSIVVCTGLTAYNSFLCALVTVERHLVGLAVANAVDSVVCLGVSIWFIHHNGMIGTSYALILSQVLLMIILLFFIISKNNKNYKKENKTR